MKKVKIGKPIVGPQVWQQLDHWKSELQKMNQELVIQPAVNIKQNKLHVVVEMALPGFQKSDILVEIEDRILSVQAEKKSETEETEESMREVNHWREFETYKARRRFRLSDDLNAEDITANYEQGVLTLHIPVLAQEGIKKIEIL